MTKQYPVFTVRSGEVCPGAALEKVHLKAAGVEIWAVRVGEEGRGRVRGLLPVSGLPSTPSGSGQEDTPRLLAAGLGQTRSGRPKLLAASQHNTDEACIVVLRTTIGYRGSNQHTGDLLPGGEYAPFPGEVLCHGVIAQGAAGRMGAGEQLVALVPKGAVFRTAYSGRLYGEPPEHYYLFDGARVLACTREEREASDLF